MLLFKEEKEWKEYFFSQAKNLIQIQKKSLHGLLINIV